jgi:glutathione synthase/RimK-type ligase-like ATP-grasp enzyme
MAHTVLTSRLGIMTTEVRRELPFANAGYYRRLCQLGQKAGLEAFVFSPNRIDWEDQTVPGFAYSAEEGGWVRRRYPLPDLIYDRCFFTTREQYLQYRTQTRKLRMLPGVRFMGYGLSGKWEVQQMLLHDPQFHSYLPKTQLLKNANELLTWFKHRQDVFLKPQGGSQGRGALYITTRRGGYHITGRDSRNQLFHHRFPQHSSFARWLQAFIGGRRYLAQEYLELINREGASYDVRSLVQKNGNGLWELTGMAVRCGQPGSVTSNLHGGGTALQLMPFLVAEFGETKAQELCAELKDLSERIPIALEAVHGRLVELGIDFGVDRYGKIWIIEVNSKPGRSVFKQLRNHAARFQSIANPIRYAKYLLLRKQG